MIPPNFVPLKKNWLSNIFLNCGKITYYKMYYFSGNKFIHIVVQLLIIDRLLNLLPS